MVKTQATTVGIICNLARLAILR